MQLIIYYINVVDWHGFDADQDPTSFFNTDPDPDRIRILSPRFTQKEKFLILIHSSADINCSIFLVSVIGVKIGQNIEILWNKV